MTVLERRGEELRQLLPGLRFAGLRRIFEALGGPFSAVLKEFEKKYIFLLFLLFDECKISDCVWYTMQIQAPQISEHRTINFENVRKNKKTI